MVTLKETNLSKRDYLRISTRADAIPLKEAENGLEITVTGYALQSITNESTGETFDSILVLAADGSVYATRSDFFIRSLIDIYNVVSEDEELNNEPLVIKITKMRSKNGNIFTTCSYA